MISFQHSCKADIRHRQNKSDPCSGAVSLPSISFSIISLDPNRNKSHFYLVRRTVQQVAGSVSFSEEIGSSANTDGVKSSRAAQPVHRGMP